MPRVAAGPARRARVCACRRLSQAGRAQKQQGVCNVCAPWRQLRGLPGGQRQRRRRRVGARRRQRVALYVSGRGGWPGRRRGAAAEPRVRAGGARVGRWQPTGGRRRQQGARLRLRAAASTCACVHASAAALASRPLLLLLLLSPPSITITTAKVVFYDGAGRQQQVFDYSSDDEARAFASAAFNPAGDAAVVGAFNRLYVFSYSSSRGVWQQVAIKQARVCVGGGVPAVWLRDSSDSHASTYNQPRAHNQPRTAAAGDGLTLTPPPPLLSPPAAAAARLTTFTPPRVCAGSRTAAGWRWAA